MSPTCRSTTCSGRNGLGPVGLANDENPLPLLTNIFLPTTLILVGYQPTGIKPFERLLPATATLKTARQLLSAFATYKVFSSVDNASPLDVEPSGALGYKAAFKTSTWVRFFTSTTETLLSLAFAIYNKFPFLFKSSSFGLSPTATSATTSFFCVSNTSTLSPPHIEM